MYFADTVVAQKISEHFTKPNCRLFMNTGIKYKIVLYGTNGKLLIDKCNRFREIYMHL